MRVEGTFLGASARQSTVIGFRMPVRRYKGWRNVDLHHIIMAKVLAFAVLCFIPFVGGTKSSSSSADPVFQIPLDAKGDMKMYWTLDYSRNRVQFEIHVPLAPSQWFAVGFSDYGEMTNADLCVLWMDWKGGIYMQVGYNKYNYFVNCLFNLHLLNLTDNYGLSLSHLWAMTSLGEFFSGTRKGKVTFKIFIRIPFWYHETEENPGNLSQSDRKQNSSLEPSWSSSAD